MASAEVCGTVLGGGLWLFLVRLPFMRPITFAERIGPQLRVPQPGIPAAARRAGNVTPFGPLERILRPVFRDGLARWAG